ncbi:MAG: Histidine--tRNA ligase [Parcubacteria group bacterium Gr01-1014_18]|nr:MAG: Histidine--tRNA ligase [Parcubacteria group bacterium Greene0416_36]TSC81287.1 MAG: Histidine--tRNA ligase [Parcubacteria group bacterium Gr01-1014_18]TSC99309.1 MAG: Histidine--tRNA ligase [Parcubacteria group bacterium Greene1014_20]
MPKYSKAAEVKEIKRPKKMIETIRGMKDLIPGDQKYWDYLEGIVTKFAHSYSFRKVQTPVLENPQLYSKIFHKKGKADDDSFLVEASNGEKLVLRPDLTVPMVRSYFEHALEQSNYTVKLYSSGPVFRQEAKGRSGEWRSAHQLACYIFDEKNPLADVQVIMFSYQVLREAGFSVTVSINSMGCSECRDQYKEALLSYYRGKKKLLCQGCQESMAKAPLYVLDCSEDACSGLKKDAPQSLDWLCAACKDHFMKVLECLDEVGISYALNPYLVSGLDMHAKVVFEIIENSQLENSVVKPVVLGAGGRYDELINKMMGVDVALVGFTLMMESSIKRIRQLQLEVLELGNPDIFVAQLGDVAKKRALALFEQLRRDGISVSESFAKDNLKAQLELATRLGVKFALILGQKEILDGTIIIRDMDGGVQEIVDFNKVILEIKKRLRKMESAK